MLEQQNCIIEIDNAVKRYGDFTALKGLSLNIKDKEFFTLLGPSGCGKTTLLRMIAGFEEVTEGKIFLRGEEIESLPANKRPVNTVFQDYALFPHMSVMENVMFGVSNKGGTKAYATTRAGEMLELVQLSQFADRKPSQLSGGQRQRVALARALAPKPKVLLLDEPLSALDLKLRKEMQRQLKHIQMELGITFIFVTHDQEEALTMSDRIAVMSEGEIQQLGTSKEIYETPHNVFVADFIGETNLLEVSVDAIKKGRAVCHLGGGHELTCDEVPGIGVGSHVHLSVRPERLFISDEPTESESLKGTVKENIFTGTDLTTIVKLEEGPDFFVRTSNSERGNKRMYEPGTPIFINIERGAGRLLED